LPRKIAGLDYVGLIGGAEDHSLAEIQCQHFRLFIFKGQDERDRALGGGNHSCASVTDHVHTIEVARHEEPSTHTQTHT